ncbi:MAG: hypothetical protein WAM14_13660 [Candidatus Nitrosopolaris sp.]
MQQTHEFIDELEKELGRKLTDNQVQNAARSIKKARKNMLIFLTENLFLMTHTA